LGGQQIYRLGGQLFYRATPFLGVSMDRLDEINLKLDIIIQALSLSTSGRTYSIKSFCEELGISSYTLKKIYRENSLPICAPFRMNGHDASYTGEELMYMRKWLMRHKY
ncbi:MAG: hypothetical protein ACI4M9_07375, partial [Succinivibrio sp.]